MNALEIEGLTKSFTGFTLDGLDLTLPSGCIIGLIGENGAGKSTTIRLVLNMLRRDAGSIRVFDTECTEANVAEMREDIGVVLDEVGFPDCLTAVQVGKVMANVFSRWDDAEYTRLLRLLTIPENKPFKEFSRGMKMKLGIAVAMSHRARLLLLDEPTSGLDPVVRDEVVSLFSEFTRDENHAILISSHIVSDLEKLCDYVAFLHRGKLMLCEEKDLLLSEYGILHCTEAELSSISPGAVKYKHITRYGADAIVQRSAVPAGMKLSPVTLEELFVVMAKEAK